MHIIINLKCISIKILTHMIFLTEGIITIYKDTNLRHFIVLSHKLTQKISVNKRKILIFHPTNTNYIFFCI